MDEHVKAKRIIPCFDILNGEAVTGVNFTGLRQVGDLFSLAQTYQQEGADELILLNIAATAENQRSFRADVQRLSQELSLPITAGGGIASVADAAALVEAGATKVTINSAALREPKLVDALASALGSSAVTVAIDVERSAQGEFEWEVCADGGRTPTGREALTWAKEVVERGAGEIILTSKEHDGTKSGYNVPLTQRFASALSIPIIASGGAGAKEHFLEILGPGGASGALAASLFHFRQIDIRELKIFLQKHAIAVVL